MHLVVIAAFAMVLARDPSVKQGLLATTATWAHVLAGATALLPLLLAAAGNRWVLATLDHSPQSPDLAQRRQVRVALAVRVLLLLLLAAAIWATPWPTVVRDDWALGWIWGVDDMVILAPFFLGAILSWVALYPADRAIRRLGIDAALWSGQALRPVWGLRGYLAFNVRHHLLLIVVPMFAILVANDMSWHYHRPLARWSGVPWAGQAVFVALAGCIFLLSPVILRYVWSTRRLPDSALRARLEAMARQVGMRYREILLWRTDGVVVNAGVMGIVAPVRYVVLSDGLLESMEDEKIEAVFGHETGHIKHHHITFYMLFAALCMLLTGGVLLLADRFLDLDMRDETTQIALQGGGMAVIAVLFVVGFGWVSRRFERQADVYGARSITPPPAACRPECLVHGVADGGRRPSRHALCVTAAEIFAHSLEDVARLNGIPLRARSWRHSSIASRMAFVRKLAADGLAGRDFAGAIIAIKVILVVGTAIGSAVAARLYWPEAWRWW